MNKPVIEFIFDFGSPNAYLVHKVLPLIAEWHGAEIKLIPCLLGGIFKATGNQAPFSAFAGIKGKLDYDRLEMQRFVERHELTAFRMNPHFPISTLTLMRGMVAAQHLGVEGRYLEIVLAGMWEDGEKLDDPAVLLACLTRGGLDGQRLIELANSPEVKAELAANTDAAVARGVFGIPTFFVGDEMFFGKERLGQIEDLLNKLARAA
ncbi:MAG: 2-hydroxychromene-2-carboxylate isomerase [Novosphingobium sp.]